MLDDALKFLGKAELKLDFDDDLKIFFLIPQQKTYTVTP